MKMPPQDFFARLLKVTEGSGGGFLILIVIVSSYTYELILISQCSHVPGQRFCTIIALSPGPY